MRLNNRLFVILVSLCIALLAGCGAGCGGATYHGRYVANQVNVSHLLNSVVQLTHEATEPGGMPVSFCSGFFITPTRIATASHCVAQHVQVEVAPGLTVDGMLPPILGDMFSIMTHAQWRSWSPSARMIITRVVAFDEHADVAILELDSHEAGSNDWLTISNTRPLIADEVYSVSNPGHLDWLLTVGTVSQVEPVELGGQDYIMNTAPVYFGSSGSPLINAQGEVIGVVVMIAYRMPVFGMASPIIHLRNLEMTIDPVQVFP